MKKTLLEKNINKDINRIVSFVLTYLLKKPFHCQCSHYKNQLVKANKKSMVHLEIPGKIFPETFSQFPISYFVNEYTSVREIEISVVFGFWCCPVAYSVPINFPNMEKASSE